MVKVRPGKKSKPPWTDQQRAAIRMRKVSVALSAGAGCGKTSVLTERFLSHLEPAGKRPATTRLNQLVAITFTERAAREMRDRIRNTCRQRLLDCPKEQAPYWRELLRELDSARISTIHSFCGALLRSHAVEAGLDPRFRVLEETQAETLLYELIEQELRRRLADGEEALLELAVRFNLDRLREMIAELLGRRHEIDWAFWKGQTPEAIVAGWEAFWRDECLPRQLRRLAESPEAKMLRETAEQSPSAHPSMRERFAVLCECLSSLSAAVDFQPLIDRLQDAARVQGGGTKKDWSSEEHYERFKNAAAAFRKKLDAAKERLVFDSTAAQPVAAWGLDLLRIAESVGETYAREKQRLGVLDFDDLLIHARNLLAGPQRKPLRQRWARNLRLLLVDEFQDTDPLQVELIQALCDHKIAQGKLFFVGDFNQSIYRFRGARPEVFRRLREKIPPPGRLPLTLNFRSQPAILEFVNTLFRDPFDPKYEELHARRCQTTSPPAVEFLWAVAGIQSSEFGVQGSGFGIQGSGNSIQHSAGYPLGGIQHSPDRPHSDSLTEEEAAEDVAPAAIRRRRREAEGIARRIRAMLDHQEKIVVDQESEKTGRPQLRAVQPGDIALLFRALTNVQYYEEALRRSGIDYYLVGGHAFYAQQEIYDLLNLLQAIESPADELSLSGVLRSPFFNLWDETIFWLARQPKGLSVGLFSDLPVELIPEQAERVRFAAATLQELRELKDRLPIAGLIQRALDRTAYDALLLAEFLGERKLANLKKLINQARNFDQSGIFSLADFIAQLKDFVVRQPKEPLAATQAETASVVRLMTIHQAKGLEFPVVFIPNLDRKLRGPRRSAAFSPRLGALVPGESVLDGFDLYMQLEQEEEEREDLRLLYVAATRAADYLVLSAGVDDLKKVTGPWMGLLAVNYDLSTGRPRKDGPLVEIVFGEPRRESILPELKGKRPLDKLHTDAEKCLAAEKVHLPSGLAPIPPDPRGRRQFSFSRLTGKMHSLAAPLRAPTEGWSGEAPKEYPGVRAAQDIPINGDDQPPRLDPRGLGSLVHAVLAEVDFAQPGDWEPILTRYAELHLQQGEMNFPEVQEMLARFLDSPRARQIAQARQVHRELEFLLAWPPGNPDPEGKFLQGYIDCLYQDAAGAWRLLDYKTNRITAETLPTIAAQYELQMLVYALAVETLLKNPPQEIILHFLRTGEEHRFPWNEKSKHRVIKMVDDSLHKAATVGRAP
jgi:ATP-dependent helicase/nuclease subunit A